MRIFKSLFFKYYIMYIVIMLLASFLAVFIARQLDIASYFPLEDRELYKQAASIVANFMGVIFFTVGTIFVLVATIFVVKPIKDLSNCTAEVAKGNFDVKSKIKNKNDELALLVENFNLMTEQLSKNEYLHKDFVSNLSHEYKTPLTAIQGYAEILNTCNLDEQNVKEYAQNILEQSIRLSNLSHELLRLSEIENKPTNFKKTEYNLDEQIRDVIITLQKKWEEKNIELDIELDDIIFQGDKELMFHAISNLIENSIKYTNDNGLIKISLKKDTKIKFIVEDNGVGIQEEKLSKIFDRFYQADEQRKSMGSGLGLSIVNKVVELHDGLIEVESVVDKGTKFTISL